MKYFSILVSLVVPIVLFAQYYQQTPTGGVVDWTNQVIREVGIGAPNPNMPIAAQRAGAIEAAKRVALRNLLERVKGMNINSQVTVENAMVTNDVIRNTVEGRVRNFRVVDTRYKSDGSVEVEVEVPLSSMYEVFLPGEIPAQTMPIQPGTPGTNINTVYTGLIIDARGLQVKPALSPKILDENSQEVYGTGEVSRDYAVQIGVVGYEKDLNRARGNERVTNNPLVIKAVNASGAHQTDIIISNNDANTIRTAAQNLNFLQQCKVMILLD